MKYSEYINWIIQHPENFTFIHNIVEPNTLNRPVFIIYYKNPDTGRISSTASFSEVNNKLIDLTTRLEIASKEEVLLDKFMELSREKL